MKPRNREINIFNMSLLDVLCGALGAFCFLMLALFPYYAKGSGAASPDPGDIHRLEQERDKARADLEKALEQMSKMTQGQPGDVQKLMEQIDAARQREQQALQHLKQAEQQLAQARQKAQTEEKLTNDIINLVEPTLVISASWQTTKADVDLWVKNPNKTWEGPKKDSPDGGKIFYQFGDAASGPATEQDYYGGAAYGKYEVYLRLMNRGEAPPQIPIVVQSLVTRLYLYRTENKKLNLGREYQAFTTRLVDERRMIPSFTIDLSQKGMKVEPVR
jgi:hypothetical protein